MNIERGRKTASQRGLATNQFSLHHAEHHGDVGEVEEVPPRETWNQIEINAFVNA
jgi:hypothetical protein